MDIVFSVGYIFFCLWVIFMGGAEKLANTIFGYFEFGWFADNPHYIRAMAWFSMVVTIVFIFI